jgi:hypothetical protein
VTLGSTARSLAAVGILAALAALLLGAALLLRRQGGSEADRIEARHGSRVVRARATIPEGRWVTELQDVDALIRLAEAYDRVVLRVVEPDGGDASSSTTGLRLSLPHRPGGCAGTPRTLPAHGRERGASCRGLVAVPSRSCSRLGRRSPRFVVAGSRAGVAQSAGPPDELKPPVPR